MVALLVGLPAPTTSATISTVPRLVLLPAPDGLGRVQVTIGAALTQTQPPVALTAVME